MWYQKKFNKFGAKTTQYNGETYHSKFEASYASKLDLRVRGKDIKSWDRQIKISFDICPQCKRLVSEKCKKHPLSKMCHITNYYVDFKIAHKDGTHELVEVKGMETPEWKLKWKLLEILYMDDENMRLTVVK